MGVEPIPSADHGCAAVPEADVPTAYTTDTIGHQSAIHGRIGQRKGRESNPQGLFSSTRPPLRGGARQPGPVAGHRRAALVRVALPYLFSSPTRIRTWNISVEARHDHRFTIEP